MRVGALVSGGKDSSYAIVECLREGHEVVCLANLMPHSGLDELDSFMYQTVGHQAVVNLSEAMDIPLIRHTITRHCTQGDLVYEPKATDEVEDLFDLVASAKKNYNIEAVCSGAIASTYQRTRVESVCARLGLVSLAYLWKRDQIELLSEMSQSGIEALIIKISCIGMTIERHLGERLQQVHSDLIKFHHSFGINPCGEGGEFETFTLDASCFKKRIVIDEKKVVEVDRNDVCPVAYINILKSHCEPKETETTASLEKIDRSNMYELPELHDLLNDSEFNKSAVSIDSSSTLNQRQKVESVVFKQVYRMGHLCFCAMSTKIEQTSLNETLKQFDSLLRECDEALTNIGSSLSKSFSVQLYIPKMEDFAKLNQVYSKYFEGCPCPPSRSCVESSSSDSIVVNVVSNWDESGSDDRRLYVRSISHWAPANIGPYSQYVSFEGIAFVSGQIPMVPASLDILHSDSFVDHAVLSLHHAKAILLELIPNFSFVNKPEFRDSEEEVTVACVCYITDMNFALAVKSLWHHLRLPSERLVIVEVAKLPKSACIEWEFLCIDRALNTTNNVVFEVFDNPDKFLARSSPPTESCLRPCRMFVSKSTLSKLAENESFLKIIQLNCVCVVPVEAVFNGSIAVCSLL